MRARDELKQQVSAVAHPIMSRDQNPKLVARLQAMLNDIDDLLAEDRADDQDWFSDTLRELRSSGPLPPPSAAKPDTLPKLSATELSIAERGRSSMVERKLPKLHIVVDTSRLTQRATRGS